MSLQNGVLLAGHTEAKVLREVPLLQDLLSADPYARGSLCLTCSFMREVLNGRPSNLSVPPRDPCDDDLNVQWLVKGPLAKQWESLERLDLYCANLGATDIGHLRDGQWAHLRS